MDLQREALAAAGLQPESITMALFLVGAFEKKLATAIDPLVSTTSRLQNEVRSMKEAIRSCLLIDIDPPTSVDVTLPTENNAFKIPKVPSDAQQQIQRVSSTDPASATSLQVRQGKPGERRKRKYTQKAAYWNERFPNSKKRKGQPTRESLDNQQRFTAHRRCLLCFASLKSDWVNDTCADCALTSHEKDSATILYRDRARGLQTPVRSANILQITPISWSRQRDGKTKQPSTITTSITTIEERAPTTLFDSAGQPGSFSNAIAVETLLKPSTTTTSESTTEEILPISPLNSAGHSKSIIDGNVESIVIKPAIEEAIRSQPLQPLDQFIANLPIASLTDSDSPDEHENAFSPIRPVVNYWTNTGNPQKDEDIPSRPATPDYQQQIEGPLNKETVEHEQESSHEKIADDHAATDKSGRSSRSASTSGGSESDGETGTTGSSTSSSSNESPSSSPGNPLISIPHLSPEQEQKQNTPPYSPSYSFSFDVVSEAVQPIAELQPSVQPITEQQSSSPANNLELDLAYPSGIPVGYSTPATAAAVESILESFSTALLAEIP